MNMLSRREHLRAELEARLRRRFGPEAREEIAAALDRLAAERLLSDERFVESYIRRRAGRGYGPDRIRRELRHKGAPADLIGIAFEACEEDWLSLARRVRRKKFGPAPPADFRERARQKRFLDYRGFGGDFAAVVLRED